MFLLFIGCVGLFGAVLLSGVSLFRKQPFPTWLRVVHLLLLAAPIPFCTYGIIVSTSKNLSEEWIFVICFAAITLCCVNSIIRLCRPRNASEAGNNVEHETTNTE